MQALVLAGGEGTRLRPLTLTTPKPVMPFAGRPFMTFMLDWLGRHGIDDVILSCGFMSDEVKLERIAGIVEQHWPERIAPEDLGDPALWARIERARAVLLEGLDLGELI